MLEILGGIAIILGAGVFLTAGIALIRFPDAYTHVSAIGTAGGVGIVLVVGGALMYEPSVPNLVKVIIIVLLQLGTSAVGAIAIARGAYLTKVPLRRRFFDELEDEEAAIEADRTSDDGPSH